MAGDPPPARKGLLRVHLRHTDTYAECRTWVDSCPCYFSYIESVPTSEFGTTTDIRQTPGMDMWLVSVFLSSARTCHSRMTWERQPCRRSCRSRLLLNTRWVYVKFNQLSVRISAGMEIRMSNANMHCVHSSNFSSILLHPQQFIRITA